MNNLEKAQENEDLTKSVTKGDLVKALTIAEEHFAKRFAFKEHEHVKYQKKSETSIFQENIGRVIIGFLAGGVIIAVTGIAMLSIPVALIVGGILFYGFGLMLKEEA